MEIHFESLWDLQQYIATAGMDQLRSSEDSVGTAGVIIVAEEKRGDGAWHDQNGGDWLLNNVQYSKELCWLFSVYTKSGIWKTTKCCLPFIFPEVYSNFSHIFIENNHDIPYTAREMLLYINYEMMIREHNAGLEDNKQ